MIVVKLLDSLKLFFASGVFATDLAASKVLKEAYSKWPALLLTGELGKYQMVLSNIRKLGLVFLLGFVVVAGYDAWRCWNEDKKQVEGIENPLEEPA